MKIGTFCFIAAFGATIFACSSRTSDGASDGTDSSGSDLVVLCGKGDCGPELGMPTEICPDGSLGGNTGRCIKSKAEPVCHWEITKCPPPTACDCGPAPMTAVKCWDGSVSTPVCGPIPDPGPPCAGGGSGGGTAGGAKPGDPATPPAKDPSVPPTPGPTPPPEKCGWTIKPCPPPPPPVCDCGPMPAYAVKCADGSVGKLVCEPSPKASPAGPACEWTPECPPPPVDCSAKGACGPALGMPNYLCPDGKTMAGPGPCIDMGGKCGWEIISCPVCDPAGPAPKPGCKWDSAACAWVCL